MTKQQTLIIAVIVAITAIAGTAIWAFSGQASQEQGGEAHEHGEKDAEHGESSPSAPQAETHAEAEPDAVKFSAEQIAQHGIGLAKAQAGTISSSTAFQGEVRFNADRTAQITARVAGVVEAVQADLGQAVHKGQVLAVIASPELAGQRAALLAARERATAARSSFEREKRLWEQKISAEQDYLQAGQALREAEIARRNAEQSLQALGASPAGIGQDTLSRYELRGPIDGIVVDKRLALGETLKADSMVFLVSDLSTVWVDIQIPAQDIEKVKVGASALIQASGSEASVQGRISHVGNLIGAQTRTATARVLLPNPQGAWRPGLFVNVKVLGDAAQARLAVANEAIQSYEGRNVVFVRTAEGFQARAVKTGRSDNQLTEVLQGLDEGQAHATTNSFLLKAELGKGSAEHSH